MEKMYSYDTDMYIFASSGQETDIPVRMRRVPHIGATVSLVIGAESTVMGDPTADNSGSALSATTRNPA